MTSAPPRRRGLALPETDAIASLLADVMAPAPAPPAPPAAVPTRASAPVRAADLAVTDYWAVVNWKNDPAFAAPRPAAALTPATGARRLADLPARAYLAAVNWANDPGRAGAVDALFGPSEASPAAGAYDPAGRPWEVGGYLDEFAWD